MYRVQCSIIEASLGRYATHQYIPCIDYLLTFNVESKECLYIYIMMYVSNMLQK
jgi:hypothetical protein